ncbi:DUF1304 domain-containing protein [Flavobacterium sp.]|uniref:DUF1304 domain-containing protein n=1 Tax=Flavobacterium sp. TaxID=239 RepID=UPI003D0E486C
MNYIATTLILGIALLHLYILWLEMFAWTTHAKKVFRNFPAHLFEPTRAMAANQGLYNGFLAAGLLWSLLISNPDWAKNVASFFLTCIAIAGLYGARSVSKRILYVQTLPALAALLALFLL